MRDLKEIRTLLEELEHQPASILEDQDLDFKEWNARSMAGSVQMVVHIAVCMANGGGGTVVFGVNDKAIGRTRAILGVPLEVEIELGYLERGGTGRSTYWTLRHDLHRRTAADLTVDAILGGGYGPFANQDELPFVGCHGGLEGGFDLMAGCRAEGFGVIQ